MVTDWVGCPHWCPHRGSHMGVCMTCGCPASTVIGAPVTTAPRGPGRAPEPSAAPGPHQEVPGGSGPAETLLGGATVARDALEDRWRDAAS